jgi:hypothetical protein
VLGDGAAEAPGDLVLLGGQHRPALAGGGLDQGAVEGLDGRHVDHARLDALGRQELGRAQRLGQLDAAGDDGEVAALAQHVAPTDLEAVVLSEDDRGARAGEAHVDRAVVGRGGVDGLARLDAVRGHDHGHVGQDAHQGHVLEHLVRLAVLAHREARVGGADLHVQLRHADRLADLLPGLARREHREGAHEDRHAAGREARGGAGHVRLGHAHVEEALGVGLREGLRPGGAGEVGVEHGDGVVGGAELGEGFAVGVARGDPLDGRGFQGRGHCAGGLGWRLAPRGDRPGSGRIRRVGSGGRGRL